MLRRSIIAALTALAILGPVPSAMARRVGSSDLRVTPDAWSVYGGSCVTAGGVSGCEVAVDFSGNFLPTLTNSQTLGTSSLLWSDVETTAINSGGGSTTFGAGAVAVPLAASTALTLGTNGTANTAGTTFGTIPSYTKLSGLTNLVKSQVGTLNTGAAGVYASSNIAVTSSYLVLISSGGNIQMTSTPILSTATAVAGTTALQDGTIVVLTSTATQNITFVDNDTLSGSLLELGAATRIITAKKTLTLMFQATIGKWIEIAYGNN